MSCFGDESHAALSTDLQCDVNTQQLLWWVTAYISDDALLNTKGELFLANLLFTILFKPISQNQWPWLYKGVETFMTYTRRDTSGGHQILRLSFSFPRPSSECLHRFMLQLPVSMWLSRDLKYKLYKRNYDLMAAGRVPLILDRGQTGGYNTYFGSLFESNKFGSRSLPPFFQVCSQNRCS